MIERPVFPPLFRAFAVTPEIDPFERAIGVAMEGAEPGTLLWSIGTEAAELAIVLAPEQALEPSLPAALVASLALSDALGALIPPVIAITLGWPDRLEVNGGVVGGVRLTSARGGGADEVPEWLVIGFGIAFEGDWADAAPKDAFRRTTLADEGCSQVQSLDLLEGFSRHLLSWLNRWQEDGVGPVIQAWLARTTHVGKPVEVDIEGETVSGSFAGLSETGAMRVEQGGEIREVVLEQALQVPTWSV